MARESWTRLSKGLRSVVAAMGTQDHAMGPTEIGMLCGQGKRNSSGWAFPFLRQLVEAGLADCPQRGKYVLTDLGLRASAAGAR